MASYTDMLAAYGVTVARPGGMAITKHVLESFPIKEGKVLEIGCGLGETAKFITTQSDVEVISIDQHPKMIQKAKKRNEKNKQIQWVEGDFLNYQTAETFDYCIAESVLSFTPIEKTFKKIHSLLNDHGIFYLLEPIYLGGLTEEEYEKYVNFYQFTRILSKKEWLNQLKDNHFSVKKIIKSEDMIQVDKFEESYPDLILDPKLDQDFVNIYNQHLQLTNQYLAYFDYYYFICKKI